VPAGSVAERLSRLPQAQVCGIVVPVAHSARARLMGLALLDRGEAGAGLLLPRCSSVHTFGMRFPLLVVFLDVRRQPLALRLVQPRRFAAVRSAAAVLEIPAGGRDRSQ
jgi:uncharacterized membrane protein (UPF0127 family)